MGSSSPLYRSEFEPRGFSSRSHDRFWPGFATGALIGAAAAVGGYMIAGAVRGSRDRRIVRFETSIQIGRTVADVFKAWSNFERLPEMIERIQEVHATAHSSQWRVNVDGKDVEWRAETTQFIPNESIGWKSVSGPKHTGRIVFSPVGDDTLMHVTVNYAPPFGRFAGLLSPMTGHVEGYISDALRDFKAALEDKSAGWGSSSDPATVEWRAAANEGNLRGVRNPVEYTRPPQAGYPTRKKRDV